MRKISLIGWTALAAAGALAAAPSSASAEGFRLRLGVGSAVAATPVPVPPRATEGLTAAVVPAVPPVAAEPPKPVAALTPVSVAPASERAKPVRVAGPWCPPGRLVGAGVGFCEVN